MWTFRLSIWHLLIGSAVGTGTFLGCTTPTPPASSSEDLDDSEDDDSEDVDNTSARGDAGKDAGRDAGKDGGRDAGRRDASISVSGDAGPAIASCPGDLSCSPLPLPVPGFDLPDALCLDGMLPPRCPASKDCSELDLPGARCVSVSTGSTDFAVCIQACEDEDGGDDGDGPSIVDAGRADAGRVDAGRADAGRADAGRTNTGRSDAGRTTVRDGG